MKKQDVRYGTSFPNDQTDGSIFVRTDLPGCMMFQYDAKNNVYRQIEAITIKDASERCHERTLQFFQKFEKTVNNSRESI